jgi:DNA-binding SARP family transcriptional activator
MGILRISLFGSVRVAYGNYQEIIKLTRASQLLLAYLVLQRNRLHPRDALLDLFWSDYGPDRARNCLNTALWRLRRALEPLGKDQYAYLINSHTGDIGFNPEANCWLDVAVFENLADRVLKEPIESVTAAQVQELEKVLALYTGDLLEGVYEEWALVAREYQRLLYIRCLDYLMRYFHCQAAYHKGIEYGKAILILDPLREEVHRSLMQLYMECGQRSLAVRQYETCRQQLLGELGIQPMEETKALYSRVTGTHPSSPAGGKEDPSVPVSLDSELKLILRELHQTGKNLEMANHQFGQILQQLEKYSSSHFG